MHTLLPVYLPWCKLDCVTFPAQRFLCNFANVTPPIPLSSALYCFLWCMIQLPMQPCLRHTLQLPKNKKERRRQERQEEKQARADAVEQRERKTSTYEEQRRAKQDQKEAVRRAQV